MKYYKSKLGRAVNDFEQTDKTLKTPQTVLKAKNKEYLYSDYQY